MTTHTPGPWKAVDDYGRWEIESRLHAIATVNDNPPQHKANARLITAAPSLLEALVELIDQLEGIGIIEWHGAEGLSLSQARAAITNATTD